MVCGVKVEELFPEKKLDEAAEIIGRLGLTLGGDSRDYERDMSRSFGEMVVIRARLNALLYQDEHGISVSKPLVNGLSSAYNILKAYRGERIKENRECDNSSKGE